MGVLLLLLAACASVDRYQGLDADALYQAGLSAFEAGDWEDAIAAFNRHLSAAPGHARNAEARFYTARAHAERQEYISAAGEFELFQQLYPNHGLAPQASLGICQAYAALSPIPQRDQEYTELAVLTCSDTVRQFQGLNIALEAEELRFRMLERLAEAQFERARFYRRRGGVDSSILYFEEVVRSYPETRWAPRAILEIHRAYRELGWEEEAADEAERLLARYPASDAAQELRAERGDPASGP